MQFDSVLVGRFPRMSGAFAGSDYRRCPSDINSCLEQNEQEPEQSCARWGENVMINRRHYVIDVKQKKKK